MNCAQRPPRKSLDANPVARTHATKCDKRLRDDRSLRGVQLGDVEHEERSARGPKRILKKAHSVVAVGLGCGGDEV
jgi:hypothetical protein